MSKRRWSNGRAFLSLNIMLFGVVVGCATTKAVDVSDIVYMPEESAKQYLNVYLPSGWVDQPWFDGSKYSPICYNEKFTSTFSEIVSVVYIRYLRNLRISKKYSDITWCGRYIDVIDVSESDAENIFKALVRLGASEAVFKVRNY